VIETWIPDQVRHDSGAVISAIDIGVMLAQQYQQNYSGHQCAYAGIPCCLEVSLFSLLHHVKTFTSNHQKKRCHQQKLYKTQPMLAMLRIPMNV
jgi:hypothetical protein